MFPEGRALSQPLLAQPEGNCGAEDRSGGWRSPLHLLGPPPGLSDRPHGREAPFLWFMARAFSEGSDSWERSSFSVLNQVFSMGL